MTKKDYVLIANSIVSGISIYLTKNNKEDIDIQLLSSIVTSISDGLYSRNTSFNREIFKDYILKGIVCLSKNTQV